MLFADMPKASLRSITEQCMSDPSGIVLRSPKGMLTPKNENRFESFGFRRGMISTGFQARVSVSWASASGSGAM